MILLREESNNPAKAERVRDSLTSEELIESAIAKSFPIHGLSLKVAIFNKIATS